MQVRHRIPTIFNLSMVDVLCCALGCVILLWLLNLREARERTLRASETTDKLELVQHDLNRSRSELEQTARQRDEWTRRAKDAAREREETKSLLESSRREAREHQRTLEALRGEKTALEDRLARLTRDQKMLTREKTDALERSAKLAATLLGQEKLAKSAADRVQDLTSRLRGLEAELTKAEAESADQRVRVETAEKRARALETEAKGRRQEMTDAGRRISSLERDKEELAAHVRRIQAAAESRFAGIALTGRRVLFLVDMSGSMELIDERSSDPEKWRGVRETLAKVMRSLSGLEAFQVIAFSEKVSFPLGREGQWHTFDANTSVNRVVQALAAIKPQGATNMYEAFEAAFRYRDLGLDTIYVLSDGLPNVGPGLTPEQASITRETDRAEILARHVRTIIRTDWNRAASGRARVHVNTIGFFYESPDVGAFLWALARENDGSFVGMSRP